MRKERLPCGAAARSNSLCLLSINPSIQHQVSSARIIHVYIYRNKNSFFKIRLRTAGTRAINNPRADEAFCCLTPRSYFTSLGLKLIKMGNKQSDAATPQPTVKEVVKTEIKEVVKYVESDASKRAALLVKLDNQLDSLKKEVATVEPIIKENVLSEVQKVEDAAVLRYSQLQDVSMIQKNIKQVFKGFPVMSVLVDAASNMVAALNSTEELTEILRWQHRTAKKRIRDKVYGIEVHYKVNILEETKSTGWRSTKKETVVLVAYKAIASVMDLDPSQYPDEDEFAAIKF